MVDTGLCKTVKIRFEKLMPMVTIENAVSTIIAAQRKELEEISIPRWMYHGMRIARVLPNATGKVIKDFAEAIVESDQ